MASPSQVLVVWCRLIIQLHEGQFLHSEILKQLLVIPAFQNNMIPPCHAGFLGPGATVHLWAYCGNTSIHRICSIGPKRIVTHSHGEPSPTCQKVLSKFHPASCRLPAALHKHLSHNKKQNLIIIHVFHRVWKEDNMNKNCHWQKREVGFNTNNTQHSSS